VILDKNNWEISVKSNPIQFSVDPQSLQEHQKNLKSSILKTIHSLKDLDFSAWALPLSGGYDSRALLSFLVKSGISPEKIKTITWGLPHFLSEKNNDAFIAQKVAEHFGLNHQFYSTELSSESINVLVDRFLFCGEGRIDHLAGYMDRFKIWKHLYTDGIPGIIQILKIYPNSTSSLDCRRRFCRLTLIRDLMNLWNNGETDYIKHIVYQP